MAKDDLVAVGFKTYRDLDQLVSTIAPRCGFEKGQFIQQALYNLCEEWHRNGTIVGRDFQSHRTVLEAMRKKAGLDDDGE